MLKIIRYIKSEHILLWLAPGLVNSVRIMQMDLIVLDFAKT